MPRSKKVVESLPYNEKVDVYAFGLLLWEMLEGNRVFDGMGVADFYERVVNAGARPNLDMSWPQVRGWAFFLWFSPLYSQNFPCEGGRPATVQLSFSPLSFCFRLFTTRTDGPYDLFPFRDVDLPGKADLFPILYDLAHVSGWKPYDLHDL